MKYIFLLIVFVASVSSAQMPQFAIHNISLPKEIEFYDNQFSGLYIHDKKLFLLSESRLQDSAEAKLYAINMADIEHKFTDTSYSLPFTKYHLCNLDVIKEKIDLANDKYEGLEAMLIKNNAVYFSIETNTPSANCYLIKGMLNDTAVTIDTSFLIKMPKPLAADSSHIYNAGFEMLAEKNDSLFAFYEYNYFDSVNYVYAFDEKSLTRNAKLVIKSVDKLPFRITDATASSNNHFTAINYFYNGEGKDTVYRVPASDTNYILIKDSSGFKNYCRLIDVSLSKIGFTWKPLWVFPEAYLRYNWEGIVSYKQGYFIINDKYTPRRPYKTTLLYLERVD